MKLWVNLEKFGIELKRVQTPDGKAFPVLIIQDTEKYKTSGAIPLEQLNNPDNATKFIKLPGERKGRGLNTPMYMITKSFSNGGQEFNIKQSLSSLLNVPEDEVKKLYVEMDEANFIVNDGFADFDKFNAVVDQSTQRFYGSTLYVVKDKKAPESLIDFSQKLIEQQHGVFPKSTVANIPFKTLDAFGLNSSIIDKAFLNPDDALKQDYDLSQLTAVRLQADRAVLPISVNKDNSINIILDPNNISALAYTSYSWQKNFPLIEDYNALVSVRETSRSLLNARPLEIKSALDMEKHIENMSLVLQNFNAAQTAIKLHKPLKFNTNGVSTYISKNKDNEWRFIEKEGFNKKDEPLNWANYKKAIAKIATNNNVVSSALELRTFEGKQLEEALNKVYLNQEKLFKKYVKVIDDPAKKAGLNAVVINEAGPKVNAAQFDADRRKFDREVGQTLESQQVLSAINALAAIPEAGNIRNTMGKHVDALSLEESVTVNPGLEHADILDIYERSMANRRPSAPLTSTEDILRSINTSLDSERKINEVANLVTDTANVRDYGNLPKNMSPKIDDNYDEVNGIFKAMQHLNLSDIPYWKSALKDANESRAAFYKDIGLNVEQSLLNQIKTGFNPTDITIPEDQKAHLAELDGTIKDITSTLGKEQLKANILQYQFAKITHGLDQQTYGGWVFDRDENGNLIPFESKAAYENATKLVENGFLKANTENGSLVPDNSDVRKKIDIYVENAYQTHTKDVNVIFENIDLLNNAARSKLQFVDLEVDAIPAAHLSSDFKSVMFNGVVNSINTGLTDFNTTQSDVHLDQTLSNTSKMFANIEKQSGLPVSLGNQALSNLIKNYSNWDAEKSNSINDPATGLPLSNRAKLDALKGLASISFAHLKGVDEANPEFKERQIETGEILAKSYTENGLKISKLDVDKYQYDLSGAFSIMNQYQPSLLTGVPISDQRFGLSISAAENSYKLIKFDVKNAPDAVNQVLDASNFKDAKKEAFMLYQTNIISGLLGIGNSELNQIGEIAKAIKENNEEKVKEHSGKLLGIEFTANDLLSMNYSISQDPNRVNNKDYVIETPDTGSLRFDPLQGADLINQIALIHKLTGNTSNFDVNPLLDKIDNLDKFNAVQQYLNSTTNEQHELNSISLSYPIKDSEITSISSTLSNQALLSFGALSKNNPNLGLADTTLSLMTSIPRNNSDIVTARIIPNSWLSNFDLDKRNQLNLNISPIPGVDNRGKVNAATISDLMKKHIEQGDDVGNVSSKPILLDAVLNNPSQKANLTKEQNQILKEGGLHFVRESFYSLKDSFDIEIATSNLEVALTNLPNDLRSEVIDHMNKPSDSISGQSLRVSMGPQNGVEIPELRLGSVHDCIPHNHTIVRDISTNSLARMLKDVDATFEKNSETFNIPKFNAQKLGPILDLHKQALSDVNFDFDQYQAKVVAKYNSTVPEPHDAFLKNFPMENLTIDGIESTYAEILVNRLDDLRNNGYAKDEVYMSFGKEPFLPQLYLSTQQTVDSFAISSSIDNVDLAHGIMASTSLFSAHMPKNAIVDHLRPVSLSNSEVNEKSLLIVRQNFIEQFKKLGDFSATVEKISETVDSANLYALNNGQNTVFALAASKSRAIDLAQNGCSAVIQEINPVELSGPNKNILGQLTVQDDQQKQRVVEFMGKLPVVENSAVTLNSVELEVSNKQPSPIDAISPLAVFDSVEDAKNNVIAQKDFDESSYLLVETKTEYVEPLAHRYSPDQVLGMSGADIQDQIQLDKIWPKADLDKHIESQHQNIDALILDRAIRESLPQAPEISDGQSLATQASSYVYFINEVHKGLSSSNTANDVLDNFQKAVVKTNVFNPEFLASQGGFVTQKLDVFTKTAYQKNSQGFELADALTENMKQSSVLRIYEKVIKDLAHKESLYTGEKSFINYMNGPVLNAPVEHARYLSMALSERMMENRNPPSHSLVNFETNTPNPLIRADVSALINGKTPVDFNAENELKNLNLKWGVETTIDANNKIFEKGYLDVANTGFESLHESLGGDSKIRSRDLSLGGMTLEFGALNNTRDPNFISLPTMESEMVTNIIKGNWLANLNAKIEAEELKVMPEEHAAKYAEFINEGNMNGQSLGLISYVENYGYQPKTEGLKNYIETFQNLKNESGVEPKNVCEQLIEHAAMVQTQKEVAFSRSANSYDSYDDDMRNRTFFVEGYANQYVRDMSARQDDMLRKIETKMSSISNEVKGSTDLYDFEKLAGQLDKTINIPLPTSKIGIDKYAESKKNSNIAKDHGYDKEMIILEITSNLDSKSQVFTNAQDVLAARAASKFIALMDKYAPETAKTSPEYVDELNKYFNLGESAELKAPNFKSAFGQAYEQKHEKMEIYNEYPTEFSPEDLTMAFLRESISAKNGEKNLVESEKDMGVTQLIKMAQSLPSNEVATSNDDLVLKKDKKYNLESN